MNNNLTEEGHPMPDRAERRLGPTAGYRRCLAEIGSDREKFILDVAI